MKISVAIPTYKRINDLKECLDSILIQTILPVEVIVVDNENSPTTEDAINLEIKKFESKGIKLKYIANTIENSLTVARNLGVKNTTGDIVSFLDDDMVLYPEYYQEITRVFAMYPDALGVAGYPVIEFKQYEKAALLLINIISRLFYQNYYSNNKFKLNPSLNPSMLLPGVKYKKNIFANCQWISGASTIKKEVFNEFTYDEILKKYSWGDDHEFGYRIYKKYPNSLFFNLNAKYIHKVTQTGRASNKVSTYGIEVYHLYLFYKIMDNTIKNKIIYAWSRIGKILFKIIFLFYFGKRYRYRRTNFIDIIYIIKAYFYCFKHLEKIKKGDLEFINKQIMKQ
ncbi:MAG: glycosyltransferase [Bacteroidales bacterium]|jgi:glycosyltransferase involved in cell wall biosynthesis